MTDRDLAIEIVARGAEAAALRIGQIASRPLVSVAATASVQEAVGVMEKAGVRRLLVVDAEGCVTGLVSADDL
ncbi:MAG TPA: CBS domain-containing protein, partial [Nitrospira sp.]|nr:CBS domain-containing protein [Nitrospira sp.]